jgi:hypothetical protein
MDAALELIRGVISPGRRVNKSSSQQDKKKNYDPLDDDSFFDTSQWSPPKTIVPILTSPSSTSDLLTKHDDTLVTGLSADEVSETLPSEDGSDQSMDGEGKEAQESQIQSSSVPPDTDIAKEHQSENEHELTIRRETSHDGSFSPDTPISHVTTRRKKRSDDTVNVTPHKV